MLTTREKFIEHYLVLYRKSLLTDLPEEATVTKMLHTSTSIINHLNAHLIAAIYQNLKKEE